MCDGLGKERTKGQAGKGKDVISSKFSFKILLEIFTPIVIHWNAPILFG